MDRTGWIVVIACFLLLIFYQPILYYFYPPPPPAPPAAETETAPIAEAPAPAEPTLSAAESPEPKSELGEEKTSVLENEFIRAELTTHGGGIKEVILKQHEIIETNGSGNKDVDAQEQVHLNRGGQFPVFNLTGWFGKDSVVEYQLEESTPQSVTFTKALPDGGILTRSYTISDDYNIILEQTVANQSKDLQILPSYNLQAGTVASVYGRAEENRFLGFAWHTADGDFESHKLTDFNGFKLLWTIPLSSPKSEIKSDPGSKIDWVAVKTQFFAIIIACEDPAAMAFRAVKKELPSLVSKGSRIPEGLSARFEIPGVQVEPGASFTQRFNAYLGPKEDWRLRQLDAGQEAIMEFGFMAFISRPMLMLMNFIQKFVLNYGLAIIIMTILIRAALWWPQTAANKSMKRMQAVAPEMKKLQEKYKEKPEKLQQEMLKMYQTYGVNPIGGCLPMLVQMPIFFGFYYMLMSSVELRGSQFLWIRDLSQPDTVFSIPGLDFPINPMPIIMAVTMYFSMSITPQPQGMDNPMMKIMKFMPLMFLLFCYNFSSALSLYWTMQNILSMGQMYYNLKQPMPSLEEMQKKAKEKQRARREMQKRLRRPGR